jgi:peptidylprolyl isomerase
MSSLRSDRARRRAGKLRNTRIFIVILLVLILAGGAYWLFINQQQQAVPLSEPTNLTDLPSGLQYEDLEAGEGDSAAPGMLATVHYTGWLEDGTKFDSSLDSGQPFSFTLGAGDVIQGWDEGLIGMKVGGKRRLVIPSNLAYGTSGAGNVIPPNATLIFEVELLELQ